MRYSFQKEIKEKYDMMGIDPSIPEGPVFQGINPPDWIDQGPIYEIFVRNFSIGGTFVEVQNRLTYLKDLGVKTIWLMPVHPIGKLNRKGTAGSPYAIMDHMGIHSDYGTDKDFKNLVDAIHDHDMKIIIDMVLNHAAPDHVTCTETPDLFNVPSRHTPSAWSDVIEFDYENSKTREYALQVLIYWIQKFEIDGYRCDVAGLVPIDFWEYAADKLLNLKPDLFLLAEWEQRSLHKKSFHAGYDWTLYFLMKEVNQNLRPVSDLMLWLKESNESYPQNTQPLRFTENHDLPRTTNVLGHKKFWPYAAFTFFTMGIPLIYNGQETGMKNELPLFESSTIEWHMKNEQVADFYKKLILLRYTNQSVFKSEVKNILNDRPDKVVTFLRRGPKQNMLFVLNFSDTEQKVKIQMPEKSRWSAFNEILNGNKIEIKDNRLTIKENQIMVLTP